MTRDENEKTHDLVTDADLIGRMCALQWELGRCLAEYLGGRLPALGGDWWRQRVAKELEEPRSERDRRPDSLHDLDLARLTKVLDANWSELVKQDKNLLRGRAWNCLQDTRSSVRNVWAHIPAGGVERLEFARDCYTIGLLGAALGSTELKKKALALGQTVDQVTRDDAPPALPPTTDSADRQRLKRRELKQGVQDAVKELEGVFTWRHVYDWLESHDIHMSAQKPAQLINKELRSLTKAGIVDECGGRPPAFTRHKVSP